MSGMTISQQQHLYDEEQRVISLLETFIQNAQESDNPGIQNQVQSRQAFLSKLKATATPKPRLMSIST